MSMVITIISIFVITGVVWLINKTFSTKVCHICGGVFLTWLWMLIGIFTGQLPIADYQLLVAILMGGSVTGFAYWMEKHKTLRYSSVAWKIFFIPTGFIAAYSLISSEWIIFLVTVVILALLMVLFLFLRTGKKNKRDEIVLAIEALSFEARKADLEKSKAQKLDIEKEMEDCC